MKEYFDAKPNPVTGHKVLLVPRHKRQGDGPAPLSIDNELDDLFNIYVKEIYPQFPSPKGPTVFLRNDGSSFQDGTIRKRLPEFWSKSGVRPDIRVTATNIRKWIVTECSTKKRQGYEVDEEKLRRALRHSDKVAKKCYLREDMTAVAASAMDIISMCTLGRSTPAVTPISSLQCFDANPMLKLWKKPPLNNVKSPAHKPKCLRKNQIYQQQDRIRQDLKD